jgi:hypothetical protein
MSLQEDFSRPLSYQHIENSMRSSINQMTELTAEYAKTMDAFSVAEATFKVAFAKSRLLARAGGDKTKKVTADYAEDIATVETEAERFEMEIARAKNDATRQALLSVRSRLEALRSLMASYREAGN